MLTRVLHRSGRKFPAVRRATQVLHRLAPEQAVIWADAADTAIVNSRESAAETLERVRTSNEVLISSECWSFPRCYNYTSPLVDDELANHRD